MDQKKIGTFLKDLRKEKNITQEQFSEIMGVSNRTISRWETGSNMPDLSILIQIAEFYDVEIREIFDGEKRSEIMNEGLKETVLKVADYSKDEKERIRKRMHILFLVGVIAFVVFQVLETMGLANHGFTESIASFSQGLSLGMLILGVIFTSGFLTNIRDIKSQLIKRK